MRDNHRDRDPSITAEGKDCEHHEMELPSGSIYRLEENMRLFALEMTATRTNKQREKSLLEIVEFVMNIFHCLGAKEIFNRCYNRLPNRPSFLCTSSCTYQMHLTLRGHHPDVVKHFVSVSALDGFTMTFDGFSFTCAYDPKWSTLIFFLLFKRVCRGLYFERLHQLIPRPPTVYKGFFCLYCTYTHIPCGLPSSIVCVYVWSRMSVRGTKLRFHKKKDLIHSGSLC